jgi:hypothetical protein
MAADRSLGRDARSLRRSGGRRAVVTALRSARALPHCYSTVDCRRGYAAQSGAALRYFPQFITSGLVDDATCPQLDAALRTVWRWRDSSVPWLFVFGAVLAWTIVDRGGIQTDALSWALDQQGAIAFGGFWFLYVVRPMVIGLLLGWLWRIVLIVVLFVRISRLQLLLVPSHPDGVGGLGFLERLPEAFAPVTFALSAMLASRWAHEILHHGRTLDALKLPVAMFVVVWSLLLLAPLVILMPRLRAAKRAALPFYAAMVAEQGRWCGGARSTARRTPTRHCSNRLASGQSPTPQRCSTPCDRCAAFRSARHRLRQSLSRFPCRCSPSLRCRSRSAASSWASSRP